MNAALSLAAEITLLAQDAPVDEDTNIVAGWLGFAVFAALIVAVAVIGVALTRSLRTAQRAKDSGVFGDPTPGDATDATDATDAADATGSSDTGGSSDGGGSGD